MVDPTYSGFPLEVSYEQEMANYLFVNNTYEVVESMDIGREQTTAGWWQYIASSQTNIKKQKKKKPSCQETQRYSACILFVRWS